MSVSAAWRRMLVRALTFLALPTAAAVAGATGEDVGDDAGQIRGGLTSAGSFYVEWWPEPETIPFNEMFAIHFRVLEPDDRETAIADAVVTANAWMPEHNHGTALRPRVESFGDGTATARGLLLHMEGRWQLRVGVAVGGQMERTTFDIQLEP